MKLYYTPPSDKCFDELKKAAIYIWSDYDNTNGYVDEKVNRIKHIENIRDNFMYIVAMFDMNNREKLYNVLSEETLSEVKLRVG